MEVHQRRVNGMTVVDMTGRLDSSVSGQVMDQLNEIVTSGATRLIVNLSGVNYISSAGIRSLLIAAKLIKAQNGEMRLCEATDLVARVLNESGFTNLIRIDAHEDLSISALQAL